MASPAVGSGMSEQPDGAPEDPGTDPEPTENISGGDAGGGRADEQLEWDEERVHWYMMVTSGIQWFRSWR
jgi:hypothetical protein